MGIRRKVFIEFGTILLFIIGFSIVGYWGNDRSDDQINQINLETFEQVSIGSLLQKDTTNDMAITVSEGAKTLPQL